MSWRAAWPGTDSRRRRALRRSRMPRGRGLSRGPALPPPVWQLQSAVPHRHAHAAPGRARTRRETVGGLLAPPARSGGSAGPCHPAEARPTLLHELPQGRRHRDAIVDEAEDVRRGHVWAEPSPKSQNMICKISSAAEARQGSAHDRRQPAAGRRARRGSTPPGPAASARSSARPPPPARSRR